MKNIMISKVKNEADIIETFLRYHVNIFDNIIVIDNGSLDGTYEIINALIKEGLPIELVNEAYSDFDAYRFANQYTKYYVEKYKADMVTFMDADEFLIMEDGSNPQEKIQKLDKNKIHYFRWKTYIYPGNDDGEIFSFANFNQYRDEKDETFTKVIVPASYFLKRQVVVAAGNHSCTAIDSLSGTIINEHHSDLKFCHFPVRSSSQYKKQIILNTINMICNPKSQNHTGSHWKQIYLQSISESIDLKQVSLQYSYYKGRDILKESIKVPYVPNIRYKSLIEKRFDVILMKNMELQSLYIKKLRMDKNYLHARKNKVVVWGTGGFAQKMYQRIPDEYEVVTYVDSNPEKEFLNFNGKIIIMPDKLRFFSFELIVIASEIYEEEIRRQIFDYLPFWKNKNIVSIERLVLEKYWM